MARKTDIRLRRSDTAGKIPTSANLSDGELALNTNSGALYFKKSDDTIITVHDNTILHIDSDTTVDSETGSNPKVGIGTTSPDYALDIRDNTNIQLKLSSIGASANARMTYAVNNTQKWNHGVQAADDMFTFYDIVTGTIPFKLEQGAGQNTLVVDTNSRVGIGTATPSRNLHIHEGDSTLSYIQITNTTTGATSTDGVSFGITGDEQAAWINRENTDTFISTNNTERIRIKNSGNVGIGIDAPERRLHAAAGGQLVVAKFESGNAGGALIDIENDATLASNAGAYAGLRFYNDSGFEMALTHITESSGNGYVQIGTGWASGGEKLVVHSDGNVGIGTTSPAYKLDVVGKIKSSDRVLSNVYQSISSYGMAWKNSSGTDRMFLSSDGDLNIISGDLELGGSTTITNNKTAYLKGVYVSDAQPTLRLTDTDDTNQYTDFFMSASYALFQNRNNTANGGFIFRGNNGSANTEYMRILPSGNVGIGTSSPATELDVDGAITGSGLLKINEGANLDGHTIGRLVINYQSNGNPALASHAGDTVHIEDSLMIQGANLTKSTTGPADFNIRQARTGYDIVFQVAPSTNNTFIDAMKILTDGNVGIGTSSPATKLHVGPDVLLNTYTTDRTTLAVSDITDGAELILRGQSPRIWFDATSSGNGQMYMDSAELQIYSGRPGAVGTQRLNINSSGAITFNNAFTFPTSIGSAGQVLKVPNSGTTLQWADETGGGGSTDSITDADGDTKIQVEESADEDIIRFDIAGTESMVLSSTGLGIQTSGAPTFGQLEVYQNGGTAAAVVHEDAGTGTARFHIRRGTADTYLQNNSNGFEIRTESNISTSENPAIKIANNGNSSFFYNVGIGTTNPGSLLSLEKGTRTLDVKLETTPASGDVGVQFRAGASDYLGLAAGGTGTGIVIDDSNNVGIGTDSPSDKLTVVGNTTLSGDGRHIYFGGSNTFVGENSNSNRLELRGGGSGTSQTVYIDNSGKVGIGQNVPQAKLHVIHNDISEALLLESTVDGSSAAPLLTFKRNCSDSGADADYLGQLKFKGENDAGQEIVYGKITAKIQDASDGSEDGLIEFANKKAGSNVITARLRSDSLQLLNGTGLTVAGDATITGNLTVDGTTTTLNTATLDVEDKNITLNYGSGDTSATADGAGITIQDAVDSSTNATILWDGTNDEFDFSHAINTAGAITAQRIIGTQTNGSSLYALELTRSGGGTTTPDIYGTNGTFVIGTSSSTEAVGFSSADSFFYGELNVPSKIRHTGDSDNYFSFADVDTQSFVTGNSTRLQITNSLVRLNQENNNQDFAVYSSNEDHCLYVDASTDRVGIGTATPNNKLSVSGASDGINIIGTSSYLRWNSGDMMIRNEGSYAMGFHTYDGSSSMVERMRIDSSGRVGIGTNSPGVKLTVNNSSFPQLRLEDADDLMDVGFSGNSFYLKRGDNDGHIIFRRADNADVLVADMSNKRVAIGTSNAPKATLQVEEYGIDTTETSTTATTQVAIHTFAATDFRSARFTIQITNSTDSTYHTSEILLVHDGTSAYITEFGEIHTGTAEEATFDADISSGSVRLLATPASTDSMEFKVVCHSVTV